MLFINRLCWTVHVRSSNRHFERHELLLEKYIRWVGAGEKRKFHLLRVDDHPDRGAIICFAGV